MNEETSSLLFILFELQLIHNFVIEFMTVQMVTICFSSIFTSLFILLDDLFSLVESLLAR